MSARLVPLILGAAPTIPLQRPVLLIGRHPECDVRIDVPKISRRHCCVALAYDRVVIRDLGSRNGLRVNGLLVEEAQLQSGDEVAIGEFLRHAIQRHGCNGLNQYDSVKDQIPQGQRAAEALHRA